MSNKQNRLSVFLTFLLFSVAVFIEQLIKNWVTMNVKPKQSVTLIDGYLELFYWENHGGAFGILNGQNLFFIFIGCILLALIIYVLIRIPYGMKYCKLRIALSFIAAGSLGNMIDRIFNGYVVDYIYLKKFHLPVFNLADLYITAASIFLMVLFLFVYKEKDLDFLSFRENKYRQL